MKRKIISIILTGLIIFSLIPIKAYADDTVAKPSSEILTEVNVSDRDALIKKYPDLIYVAVNEKIIIENTIFKDTELNNKMEKALSLLKEAEVKKDLSLLQNALNIMFELYSTIPDDELIKTKDNDQFDYFFAKSIYVGFLTTSEGEVRNKFFSDLMDNYYLHSIKRTNKGMTVLKLESYSNYLGWTLDKYFDDERTKATLNIGASLMLSLGNVPVDPSNPTKLPEETLPSTLDPSEEKPIPDEPGFKPPFEPPIEPIIPPAETPEGGDVEDDYMEIVDYVAINGECYKIVQTYDKKGTFLGETKTLLSKSENSYCGIPDDVVDLDEWNNSLEKNLSVDTWNSLAENDLNQLSNNTIQFTTNKSVENPYYYDTGIKSSVNDTVTYTQIKSALLQVVSKIKGYVLEDKDRLMFIAEGKPLIVIDKKTEYTSEEIFTLLDDFKDIGLKIDEKKSLTGESLENKLQNNELNSVKFKDKDISLSKLPLLKDGVLQ